MSKNKSLDQLDMAAYDYQMYDYKENGDNTIWTMKDGTDIEICNMKDGHIQNCINMMKRKPLNGTRRAWIEIFEEIKMNRRSFKVSKIVNNIIDEPKIKNK